MFCLDGLLQMQEDAAYCDRFQIKEVEGTSPVGIWLLSLPKYLWEMNSRSPGTTEVSKADLGGLGQEADPRPLSHNFRRSSTSSRESSTKVKRDSFPSQYVFNPTFSLTFIAFKLTPSLRFFR